MVASVGIHPLNEMASVVKPDDQRLDRRPLWDHRRLGTELRQNRT
jgi:hypothetical protein